MAPARQRIVDVDQFLGELVELEPALAVAIDLGPGRLDRLARAVSKIEAGAGKRGVGLFPQARLGKRRRKAGVTGGAAFVIVEIFAGP